MISEKELEVLFYLTQAGTTYRELEEWHHNEHHDFGSLLAKLRYMILARSGAFELKEQSEQQNEAPSGNTEKEVLTPENKIHRI